jgi:hypothetical protein
MELFLRCPEEVARRNVPMLRRTTLAALAVTLAAPGLA